jgi:hypothetical protein
MRRRAVGPDARVCESPALVPPKVSRVATLTSLSCCAESEAGAQRARAGVFPRVTRVSQIASGIDRFVGTGADLLRWEKPKGARVGGHSESGPISAGIQGFGRQDRVCYSSTNVVSIGAGCGSFCCDLTPPAQCASSSEEADALPSWHGHHRLPELWGTQPRPADRFRVPSVPQMQVRASLAGRCRHGHVRRGNERLSARSR